MIWTRTPTSCPIVTTLTWSPFRVAIRISSTLRNPHRNPPRYKFLSHTPHEVRSISDNYHFNFSDMLCTRQATSSNSVVWCGDLTGIASDRMSTVKGRVNLSNCTIRSSPVQVFYRWYDCPKGTEAEFLTHRCLARCCMKTDYADPLCKNHMELNV